MSTIDERGYWDKVAAQQAEDDAARRRPMTRSERHTYLLNEISACGMDSVLAEKAAKLRVELDAINAEIAAERDAEWTVEVTQQRRAEWNARVKAGEFTNSKGKIDPVKLHNAQQAQGWRTDALQSAIKRHGL